MRNYEKKKEFQERNRKSQNVGNYQHSSALKAYIDSEKSLITKFLPLS